MPGQLPRALVMLALCAAQSAVAQPAPPAPALADRSVDVLIERARRRDAEAEYALAMMAYAGRGLPVNAVQAYRLTERAAGRGHVQATYALGFFRQHGIGTPANAADALSAYLNAASRGHGRAQLAAGWLLAQAEGSARDERAAREWFAKAAEQQLPEADYNLAVLLEAGRGGASDPAGAARAYGRAADAGLVEAALPLARLLEAGFAGHPPDPDDALARYEQAAAAGNRAGQFAAGRLHLSVAKTRSGSLEKAVRWLQMAGLGGDRDAYVLLSRWFDDRDTDSDRVRAARYYRLAADAGDTPSMRRLAYLLEEGRVPETSPGETEARLRHAAATGDAEIQYRLARRLEVAASARPDGLLEAARWYLESAHQGHAGSALGLGIALDDGRGVPKDPAGAHLWLEAAAKAGLPEAHYRLGIHFDQGTGIPADQRRALERYAEAARLGHEAAQARIEAILRPTARGRREEERFPGTDAFRGLR